MIDFENLARMIAQRYISVQKHPTLDLSIYNYTDKAQYGSPVLPERKTGRSPHRAVVRPRHF